MKLTTRKFLRMSKFSPKTVNIIEDIAVDSDTPIIDEIHMSSDNPNDDVDEIV